MSHDPLLVLCYPRCSTCRRALAWLDAHDIAYTYRDIARERPSADELATWQAASGLPVRRLFNTSGRLYREQRVKARLDAGMSDEDARALLATDGMMVKRPLVVGTQPDGIPFVLVGFREAQWSEALL